MTSPAQLPPPTPIRPPGIKGIYKPGARPEFLSVCIYGRGGTGKTTLLGTMPGKGLVIDVPLVEGGTYVLKSKASRIDVVPVEQWNEIADVYKSLHLGAGLDYKWVGIDSITAFTVLAIRKVTGQRVLSADPAKISQQDWGTVGRMVSELIYQFRQLKLHTIWLAQERSFGKDGMPSVIGPDTSPAARSTLLPALTLCGRLFVDYTLDGNPQRLLRVNSHPEYDAKTRAMEGITLPDVVTNANLGKLLRYAITGEGTPPTGLLTTDFVLS